MLQFPHQPPQQVHQQQSDPNPDMRLREHNDPTASSKGTPAAHTQPPSSATAAPAATRNARKRKASPPSANAAPQPAPQQQHPPPMHLGQILAPPHALMPPGMAGPPTIYQYAPPEYLPQGEQPQHGPLPDEDGQQGLKTGPGGRQLSQSKRAEQNRKAQRAFRERRDQHVKALESRSQLLDAALASADEANRRWEECRALVDQLRIENAALRAALSQAQSQLGQLGQGQILPTPPAAPAAPHQQPQENVLEGEKTETPTAKSDA